MSGYQLLKSLGYDEKYYNVCLTHSYLNNDVKCKAGNPPIRDFDFKNTFITGHKYTVYEKIINLCDLMCSSEVMTMEKRLIDLIFRKGANENTQYHVLRFAEYTKCDNGTISFTSIDDVCEYPYPIIIKTFS